MYKLIKMKKEKPDSGLRNKLSQIKPKQFWKELPEKKIITTTIVIFGALYLSKYIINAMADTVRACRNLQKAFEE